MSAQLSPPPASISEVWTRTLPRSCSVLFARSSRDALGEVLTEFQPVGKITQGVEPDVGDDLARPPIPQRRGSGAGSFDFVDAPSCSGFW